MFSTRGDREAGPGAGGVFTIMVLMRPSVKAHPALVVDDLDAFVAKLEAAGARWLASDEIPGTRRGHTWDPFGNRIELIQR